MQIRRVAEIMAGGGRRSRRGAAPLVLRALLLAILAAALVVHHGAAAPAHGPAAAHEHGDCAACVQDGSDSDVILMACVAAGVAALLAPRRPGPAGSGATLPAGGAPRRVAAAPTLHLRAPPPPPAIDRLCVRLR